jgi:phosphatidylglycerol---prolipoprotein diacylglyceryl transferase
MPLFVLPYPVIDPVLINIGPFPIRWYALAYIAGLVGGWWLARRIVSYEPYWGGRPRPNAASLDDLLVFVALGVVLGGRIGYVLFYNLDFFLAHPASIPAVWEGGMSFHGGLIGATLGIWAFARRHKAPLLSVFDVAACVTPIGIFFGRLANFIKPELWGRVTDVDWAMVFPDAAAGPFPRHPSQLYEAALEGLALFLVLLLARRMGALRRPGLASGVFAIGYGVARIACEFFREPDAQLGFLFGGATMGMLLSVPLIVVGLIFLAYALRAPRQAAA